MLTPSRTDILVMGVLEEIFFVIIILGFGFILSVCAESDSESKPGYRAFYSCLPSKISATALSAI